MRAISGMMAIIMAASGLAGCQSPQQSAVNAALTCDTAGLRPGTRRFQRCQNAVYLQNRAQSEQAAAQAGAVAATALVGGALIGAAVSQPRYYGYGPYYGPAFYRPTYYW